MSATLPPRMIVPGPLPRRTRGRIGLHAPGRAAGLTPSSASLLGGWAAGGRSAPSGHNDYPAILLDMTIGVNWFDRIHILPREPMAFGRFVTPTSKQFEIFNAFRTPTTLTNVSNPLSPGVTLPSFPATPFILPPFSSILTGAAQKYTVLVNPSGPAVFDDDIVFTFDVGNSVKLDVSGSRVPLILVRPDGDVVEKLQFGTSVIQVAGGQEQRISYRSKPRQFFEMTYLLDMDDPDRRRLLNILFKAQSDVVGLPLWHEATKLRSITSASGSTVTIPVFTTAGIDFRVGAYILLYHSSSSFDVAPIISITSDTIVVESTTIGPYSRDDFIMPLRFAQIMSSPPGGRYPFGAENYRINYQVVDNDTGALPGDLSGYSTLNGRLFLDTPNFLINGIQAQTLMKQIVVFDGLSGLTYQTSDWDRNKHGFSIGFLTTKRSDVQSFRNLLYAVNGRLVSFYAPLRAADFKVTQNITSGTSVLTVENNGYAQYAAAHAGRKLFRITFTDGTSLTRNIASAVELSAAEEQLTLVESWPSSKTVSQVFRVEWVELSRFDSDDFMILHTGPGRARCENQALMVEDDG